MRDEEVLLWLSLTPGVGAVTVRKLRAAVSCWGDVWAGEAEQWAAAGVKRAQLQALLQSRQTFDPVRARALFEPYGVRYVPLIAEDYPVSLHGLYDPPAGLFVAGVLPPTGSAALAVVGTRSPSPYGRMTTEQLVSGCARAGLTIVSGLARGIDTLAHRACVAVRGRTIAVLGSGVLEVYPRENQALAEQIVDAGGAVLSEFAPHAPGRPQNFPLRNRLIAGLAQGTLVIEAGERSGSLITADQALEQGREVYAVPGMITAPQSFGTNRLIQEGAKTVLAVTDVLEDYGREAIVPVSSSEALPPDAVTLLAAFGDTEVHLEQLQARTGWELGRLHHWLLKLDLLGRVVALPGGAYIRKLDV